MDPAHLLLAQVWFGLLGLLLMLYVVLDGFTLGVGILSLSARDDQHRDVMMSSLGGVWDANETWLVVFGGALFGAFPVVYGLVLHGLYIPVMVLIFALIFRGVAFEFREHGRRKAGWNLAFGAGSLGAAMAQGFALGAILNEMPVKGYTYAGSVWHWLSPFGSLVAVGVVTGYALLGATYMVLKTSGEIQQDAIMRARTMGWLTAGAGLGVSIWTPLQFEYAAERWFSWPTVLYLAPLPLLGAFAFFMLLRALRRRFEIAPFAWSVLLFVVSFLGLAITLYPYFVPQSITFMESASSAKTLAFMLVGIGLLVPIMILYNAYQYMVFRGKVHPLHYTESETEQEKTSKDGCDTKHD